MKEIVRGRIYVLGDDIDTDQIIPAQHLVLNPAIAEEKQKLGTFALSSVPSEKAGLPRGHVPFIDPQTGRSPYSILAAGKNFGCGSSREHAPIALAAAGIEVVVAEFYARIFFRNVVNGGWMIPYETPAPLVDRIETGQEGEVDLKANELRVLTTGNRFPLKPLGDILPILEAGNLFAYAKEHADLLK
ncbi:MAG: 3-isopropylmalate dehydratase [Candidatus Tectomicrobia bacterium]|uniref:3-isopropylmalate dehydratase n=1 Tax=Tectimicrobiota bacterium TaxID=2528274 RepID=A0A932GRR2_UNCTE|nr:3-isopropylmalate dehydratase [Candidatus Tectomicrobia bacterium]